MGNVTKGRVLLAEDDEALRRAYARMLRQFDYEVVDVDDGTGAVSQLRSHRFDALVSDIAMPGLDGMELVAQARSADPDLPIVLMTATPTVGTAIEAVERRVLRYLVKPFDPEALDGALAEAVRVRKLADTKREVEALARQQELKASDAIAAFEQSIAQLWMAFQPIVSWSRRRVQAYEALMRADVGLRNPAAILASAEKLGRVHELGRTVRRLVAARIADVAGDADFFVNLHPLDLVDDELHDSGAPLSRLAPRVVLEITERAALDEVADLPQRLAGLRKLGYRIALDDLGAGYAGLTSFLELRPEIVKFDMTLVRHIDSDVTRQKLVERMLGLCRDLGCQVVAEGVETVAERDALSRLGFELMQGYHFGKPARALDPVAWTGSDLATG